MTEETIFAAVLDLATAAEQAAYLDRACAGDAALRARVDQLLLLHQQAASFMQRPAAEQLSGAAAALETQSPPLSVGLLASRGEGSRIGPYKLLQKIGEGGMGVVYMAEQERPVRRRVALKIIKPGMDSAQVIARFEAERQALAMMDHSGIAHVYDAGTTETGRPYFAMELVQGIPITEYCDQKQLTPKERLALFVPVCHAIQHAHTKGIIHRDIKPNNILVMTCDGKPVPKVIDFGVAKALHQTLTEKTMFTQFGGVLGTPQYMSPEQTELDVVGTDARCDIYSLGVLLYELLTGTTPLDAKKLREAGYAEMLRTIREQEPPKPSTRLSVAGDELTALSVRRGTEPRKLARLVMGDLDWIVMKCLEKDRARRYETANGLARDVERYLGDEAVEACPPSTGYRLRKLAWKYRTALRVGAVFAMLLVAATIVSLSLAVQAKRAQFQARADQNRAMSAETTAVLAEQAAREDRDRVVAEKKRADEQAAITEQVNAFLNDVVLGQADVRNQHNVDRAPKPDLTLREAVDNAAERLRTTGRFADAPRIAGALHSTIGMIYKNLGEFEKSQEHLEEALLLSRQTGSDANPDKIAAMRNLAGLYEAQGQFDKAEPLARQALENSRQFLGELDRQTLLSLDVLARSYQGRKQFAQAEPLLKLALEGWNKTAGEENPETLSAIHDLASLYSDEGQHAKAELLFQQVLEIGSRTQGPQHPSTLRTMEVLAKEYVAQRQFDKAAPLLQQALEQQRKILGPQHPDTLESAYLLSVLYQEQKQYELAEPLRLGVVQWCTDHSSGDERSGLTLRNLLPRTIDLYRDWGKPVKVKEFEGKLGLLRCQELAAEVDGISKHILELGDAHRDTPQLLSLRAGKLIRLGRFQEAVADYDKEATLHADNYYSQFPRHCLLAYLGETRRHAELCTLALKTLGNYNDATIADHAIKPYLLLPIAGDARHVVALTDLMISRADSDKSGHPWCHLTRALAQYRAGDFDACLKEAVHCQEIGKRIPDPVRDPKSASSDHANGHAARDNAAELLVAMSQSQLGHPEEARAALDIAVRQLDEDFPQAGRDDLDALGGVENWLVCQTLRREAVGLLAERDPQGL
jgi:eukaryotic-like serine/threonine-protein kinase